MEDVDLKKMIHDVFRLERENHAMLKKLVRINRRAFVFSIIYWTVIVGTTIGIFTFLRPYLDFFVDLYKSSSTGVTNVLNGFR